MKNKLLIIIKAIKVYIIYINRKNYFYFIIMKKQSQTLKIVLVGESKLLFLTFKT